MFNKKDLLNRLDDLRIYANEIKDENDIDDEWSKDEVCLSQTIELIKMIDALFHNFNGKGELPEYIQILKDNNFNEDIITYFLEDEVVI